jgi:CrcB protein
MDTRELAAIFAGGACGALARAGMAQFLPHAAGSWPWSTFAVNMIGTFLLGYVVTRLQERLPLSAYRRPFLGTGFCGALTTFSTMQVEVLDMLRAGSVALAAVYASTSIAAGFLVLVAATAIVRRVRIGA